MDENVRFAIAGDLHNAWKHGHYLKNITETYSYLTIWHSLRDWVKWGYLSLSK